MLRGLSNLETSFFLNSSPQQAFKAKVYLKKVFVALNSLSSGALGENQRKEFQGIQQQLNNLARESCPQLFWGECSQLGWRLATHPQFSAIGITLLETVAQSSATQPSTHLARQATHRLAVLRGEAGSLGEQLVIQATQMSHTQTLIPVAGGILAGSVFGGLSSIGALSKLRGTWLPKLLGGSGLRVAGSLVSFSAEGVVFSLAERGLRQSILGDSVSWNVSALLEDIGHGLFTMGGFRFSKTLGQGAWRIAHGIQGAGIRGAQQATRWATATKWTQPLTMVASEFGGALGGGWLQASPEQSGNALLASALGMMGHYRVALGSLHTAFPKLPAMQRALYRKTYELGEGQWSRNLRNLFSRLNNFQGPRPLLATAGAHVGLSTTPHAQVPDHTKNFGHASHYKALTTRELGRITRGLGSNAFPKGRRGFYQKDHTQEHVSIEMALVLLDIPNIYGRIEKINDRKIRDIANQIVDMKYLPGLKNTIHVLAKQLGLTQNQEVKLFTAWAEDRTKYYFFPPNELPPGETLLLEKCRVRFFLVLGGNIKKALPGISHKTLVPYLEQGTLPEIDQRSFLENLRGLFSGKSTPIEEHGLLYPVPKRFSGLTPKFLDQMSAANTARFGKDTNELALEFYPRNNFSRSFHAVPLEKSQRDKGLTSFHVKKLEDGSWWFVDMTGIGVREQFTALLNKIEKKPESKIRLIVNPLWRWQGVDAVTINEFSRFLTPRRLRMVQEDAAERFGAQEAKKGIRIRYSATKLTDEPKKIVISALTSVPLEQTGASTDRDRNYGYLELHPLRDGSWFAAKLLGVRQSNMAKALIDRSRGSDWLLVPPHHSLHQKSLTYKELANFLNPESLYSEYLCLVSKYGDYALRNGFYLEFKLVKNRVKETAILISSNDFRKGIDYRRILIRPTDLRKNQWNILLAQKHQSSQREEFLNQLRGYLPDSYNIQAVYVN